MDSSDNSDGQMVEAIEEGKIVRVSEAYAVREGLPILRRKAVGFLPEQGKKKENEGEERLMMDDYRKPLKWGENKVVKDLVINFSWYVSRERRKRNLSRKQLADAVGEPESSIRMIENGLLPRDDFVLISKVEKYLGLSLRKDGAIHSQDMRKLIEEPAVKEEKLTNEDKSDIVGRDIVLIDE